MQGMGKPEREGAVMLDESASPENWDRICDERAVAAAYEHMAAELRRDFASRNPLMVAVMMGGLIPAGQLLPRLDFPLQLDYLHATRYRGKTHGGRLYWHAEPVAELAGRCVILIDDILDEGHTLKAIRDYCSASGAAEVATAVLARKQRQSAPVVEADYVGLEVPDRYVFGCGMDLHEANRQWPAIYALPEP